MRQGIQFIAGVSGVFLLVAYVAGRLYLEAYYGVFNANLRDLGFSVQDVMFVSWRTLLPAFFMAALFAVWRPWLESVSERFTRTRGDFEALQGLIDDTKARNEAVAHRLEDAKERLGEEDNTPGIRPAMRKELLGIIKEQQAVLEELEAVGQLKAEAKDTHGDEGLGVVDYAGHVFMRALRSPWGFIFYGTVSVVGSFGIVFINVNETWTTRLLDGGALAVLTVSGIGVLWLSFQLIVVRDSMAPHIGGGIVALVVAATFVVPYATGAMNAHADRNSDEPGRGLQNVVLVARERVAPDWELCNAEYLSPHLRLLGSSSGLLTLWNPDEPDSILQVPVDGVLRIYSATRLVVDCI